MIHITIGTTAVSLLEGSAPTIHDTLDQRSTASFTVYDATGTLHFQYGEQVIITDDVAGLLFTGYVNDSTETNLPPNAANTILVNCFDQHYLADKRVSQTDYTNMYAGDIVTDLLANYLSYEGVQASYAEQRDTTQANFQTGTLTNVAAATNVADGDLELSPAGSTVTIQENTTSAFSSGTLSSNLTATGNSLQLTSTQAIQMIGTQSLAGASDAYTYRQIWSGSLSISTGDTFAYDIWMSTTSPEFKAGVDFTCSDGTLLRSTGTALDAQGISANLNNDLSGYANGQWYHRSFSIPSALNGKTLSSVSIGLEGDKTGTYTAYFKNVNYTHSGTTTLIFNGTLQTNPTILVSNVGYTNVAVNVVYTYPGSGQRVSPSYAIGAATLVKQSLISWTATTPTGTAVLLETSIDGGVTYQPCAGYGAIPNLLAGMRVGPSHTLVLRETLSVTGSDPTSTPVLSSVLVTILPSFATSTTDIQQAIVDFSNGTLTNLTGGGRSLTLSGFQRSWDDGVFTSQTVRGPGSPSHVAVRGQMTVTTNAATEATDQLSFAGTFTNFTVEVDMNLAASTDSYGLVYRCTNLSNNAGCWAYGAFITNYSVTLAKAQNTTAGGSITQNYGGSALIPTQTGSWHRLKVVLSGNHHQIYVDGVKYIDFTDTTSPFTAAGSIALYYSNGQANAASASFDNFGVSSLTSTLSGTYVAPSTSISSVGTVGTSIIMWNGTAPDTTSILVEVSLNGGSTYTACTNGAVIPGLSAGTNVSGKSVLIRVTLTSQNTPVIATMTGLSWWVVGQFSASGSRVGLPLNLTAVGRVGSTLVSWNANVPTNTTLAVDTSLDGKSWTQVGSGVVGSALVAGINAQPDPIDDSFSTNTSAYYTSTSQTNGSPATWTWNTNSSRVEASGGNTALLLYSSLTWSDIDLLVDTDTSDAGGLVWRFSDTNTFYDLVVGDPQSPTPNTATLSKISNGQRSILATASVNWTQYQNTRGSVPHRIRMTMLGPVITVSFDGTQILSYTDNFPLAAGSCGLRTDTVAGQSSANFYHLRISPQGDSVIGTFVFTRTRLTSIDPTQTPQLTDITTSVRSPAIMSGAFIPSTTYSVLNGSTNSIAQDLDDLAKQSNYWWKIDNKTKQLLFQSHNGTLAPFLITGLDMLLANSAITVKRDGNLFRNVPWILGGTDTKNIPNEVHKSDGITQAYTLDYPVDSLVSISDGIRSYSFGIKGVDMARDFYYQIGNNTINQDTSETPLPAGLSLSFNYNGQINVVANAQIPAKIQDQAVLEGTSGMVEVAETAQGLNSAAAQQLATSRINMYDVESKTLTFATARVGLAVGQLLHVFLPQHGLLDEGYLIQDVATTWRVDTYRGTIDATPYFTITATNGPLLNSWVTTLSQLGR